LYELKVLSYQPLEVICRLIIFHYFDQFRIILSLIEYGCYFRADIWWLFLFLDDRYYFSNSLSEDAKRETFVRGYFYNFGIFEVWAFLENLPFEMIVIDYFKWARYHFFLKSHHLFGLETLYFQAPLLFLKLRVVSAGGVFFYWIQPNVLIFISDVGRI